MMAIISNNAIPDKNMSTMMTLSLISEIYFKEAVETTAEAVKVLIGGMMDIDQTTSTITIISQIPTKTCPKTSSTYPYTRYNDKNHKSDNNISNNNNKSVTQTQVMKQ